MDEQLLQAGAITVSFDGQILHVTLDRPEARNAQTPATWAALAHVGANLPEGLRAVVLSGAGVSFSAGLDRRMFTAEGIPGTTSLVELASATDEVLLSSIAVFQEAFTWWRSCDAITIAAVHGHAIGAGFQLALACDLIVADPSALFSMRETSLGLVPDLAGTAPLVSAVGYPRALEMCTSGRDVGADEALRIGLAVSIAELGDLHGQVSRLLAPIVAAPADAVSATKHLLRAAQHARPRDQREAERQAQVERIRNIL